MKYVDFFVVVLWVLPSKRTELGFQFGITQAHLKSLTISAQTGWRLNLVSFC